REALRYAAGRHGRVRERTSKLAPMIGGVFGNDDLEGEPLLLTHDVQLQLLAALVRAQYLKCVRRARRHTPIDIENDVAVLELQAAVARRTHDEQSLVRAEILPELRRHRDQLRAPEDTVCAEEREVRHSSDQRARTRPDVVQRKETVSNRTRGQLGLVRLAVAAIAQANFLIRLHRAHVAQQLRVRLLATVDRKSVV